VGERRVTVYLLRPKDRPGYQLQWVDPDTGKRRTKSASTEARGEAEAARRDLEYEINHGLHREPSKMTWAEFRRQYEAEKLATLRWATRRKADGVLDAFGSFFGDRKLGEVTERAVSKYAAHVREKGFRPATVHGHLAYLRAALRWAVDQKFIPAVPKFVMPKLPKKTKVRKIVAEEFERLVAVAPDASWRAFLCTAWYSGMRRCEMLDLHWRGDEGLPWVDFDAARIRIPAEYNKSDADQWIPLHPELAEILAPLRSDRGRIFRLGLPRRVSQKFGPLALKAGLRITLHDLRRSFGSRYAAVVPAQVLQRLMRHANIRTTLEFYTDLDDALDEAIRKA
jgi:integrase